MLGGPGDTILIDRLLRRGDSDHRFDSQDIYVRTTAVRGVRA